MSANRTILVTGGNRGIGFATARALSDLGHRVIIGARDLAAGREAAAEIGAEAVRLDVADPASIDAALAETGPLDGLINNAGLLDHTPILDNPEGFDEAMAVMVAGPYHLIRGVAPGMADRGYGRIVNVSSGWGSFAEGLGGPGAYGVAKAALNALTVAVARDVPSTTKINAMCPGWVRTRMGGEGASLTPEEGADTAVWLATLPDDGPTGGFFRRRQLIDW